MRRHIPARPTPVTNKSQVCKTVEVKNAIRSANFSLKWGVLNLVIFLLFLYDLLYTCPWYSLTLYFFEVFITALLFMNTIFHFSFYLKNAFSTETPFFTRRTHVTPNDDDNTSYILNALSTPPNLSGGSWHSSPLLLTPKLGMSPNVSMPSPSWVYYCGSPDVLVQSLKECGGHSQTRNIPMQPNDVGLLNLSMLSTASSNGIIEDENSLSQYLEDYKSQEKTAAVSMSVEQPSNLLSSFWSHPASRTSNETSPRLRRCTYQMAPPSPSQVSSGPGTGSADDGGLSSSLYQSQEVWRQVCVNPCILTQWTANLRMWISQTILERLVKEIEGVGESLLRQGLADVRIGAVGLERLKKTAQIAQVAQNIPTLQCIIPFLDLTSQQEYLITRIKDLAKGGCMSEFRWNSGGSYLGKDWEENLPTDSAIVLHLLATYLDSQLPPLSQNPEGRSFTSQHVVKIPDKPLKGSNTVVIYQIQINPPHFVLVSGEDTLEVARGRSNLFQTLLLFLHLIKTRESGMLGRVNLGTSGINMLWVIDDN